MLKLTDSRNMLEFSDNIWRIREWVRAHSGKFMLSDGYLDDEYDPLVEWVDRALDDLKVTSKLAKNKHRGGAGGEKSEDNILEISDPKTFTEYAKSWTRLTRWMLAEIGYLLCTGRKVHRYVYRMTLDAERGMAEAKTYRQRNKKRKNKNAKG